MTGDERAELLRRLAAPRGGEPPGLRFPRLKGCPHSGRSPRGHSVTRRAGPIGS